MKFFDIFHYSSSINLLFLKFHSSYSVCLWQYFWLTLYVTTSKILIVPWYNSVKFHSKEPGIVFGGPIVEDLRLPLLYIRGLFPTWVCILICRSSVQSSISIRHLCQNWFHIWFFISGEFRFVFFHHRCYIVMYVFLTSLLQHIKWFLLFLDHRLDLDNYNIFEVLLVYLLSLLRNENITISLQLATFQNLTSVVVKMLFKNSRLSFCLCQLQLKTWEISNSADSTLIYSRSLGSAQ